MTDPLTPQALAALAAKYEAATEEAQLTIALKESEGYHHKYATWAAHEWLRSVKRGDTYRARALALLKQVAHFRWAFGMWKDNAYAVKAQLTTAEARAAQLAALLEELPKHIDQDYFYDKGFMRRVAVALAAPASGQGAGE